MSVAAAKSKFQFTPLREGRRHVSRSRLEYSTFQFTPLREGRRHRQGLYRADYDFNSRPSARGDAVTVPDGWRAYSFQFTPLREGRQAGRGGRGSASTNFNSRPSARGDVLHNADALRKGISIHAPPRGATLTGVPLSTLTLFQFTPLREGRRSRQLPARAG